MFGSLKILFVCTGNICRSAYAERRAVTFSRRHSFASAGTHALVGHPMEATMAELASERGASPAGFRSRQFTVGLARDADLILTAEAAHRAWILADTPALVRTVFTLGQFDHALADGKWGNEPDLLDRVTRSRGAGRRAWDIPDPFRQGRVAATACADRIDQLLARVFAKLG